MPQKRMAARGQSAKLAKGPSPKKASLAKPTKVEKAKKAKVAAPVIKAKAGKDAIKPVKAARPQAQIEKAKAALKKETASTAMSAKLKADGKPEAKSVKPEVKTVKPEVKVDKVETKAAKADAKPAKPEGKARGRKISIEINPNEAASALSGKWSTLYKKSEQIEAKPYNMKSIFEEKTAIVHKVLGWGYILANRNDRLEVLFKDGIKYLISNYKP